MEKIGDIIESIANEKNLEIKDVKETVQTAFINTAKRMFGENYEYDAIYNENTKKIELFQKMLIVSDDDFKSDMHTVSLSDAKKIDNSAEVGDELSSQIDIESYGRTASANLAKELNYHIEKLLEEKAYEKYSQKVDTLVFGNVVFVDDEETTYIEFDDLRAFMPRRNRIKDEKFKIGDVVRAVIRKVFIDKKRGVRIEVSRTSPKFLEALLKAQVPEIQDGGVIVKASARIPGRRAKVALSSISPNIDPIGATVGVKGVRIDAVSKELNDENIDVIEYSAQPEIMLSRAMAPAIISSVKIEGQKAIVYLNSDQKSKAIGKEGINIRLASMITGLEIQLMENEDKKIDQSSDLVKDLKSLFG